MFAFDKRPAEPLVFYLEAYLSEPAWAHAVHVVPLLAWLSKAWADGRGPWPPRNLPGGALKHLQWCLRGWSAFRGAGGLEEKIAAFEHHLPRFIDDLTGVLTGAGKYRLAKFDEGDLEGLGDACDGLFPAFSARVKGNARVVLPSKTAHLLFPSVIPAYDRAVVREEVLDSLMPGRMRGRLLYRTYLRASWWILGQLEAESSLGRAGRRTLESLRGDWVIEVLEPSFPSETALPLLDTFVSEYTLIGLARSGVRLVLA
jgi:hypothetical protein